MGYGGSTATLRDLDTLFRAGALGGLTDGQLLERFARGDAAGEAAFEALVGRHGAMVARVCRGTLDDDHEAQDAAQATFLILARRAGSIRRRESVASWLFGVAARVSARARVDAARRRRLERRAAAPSTRSQADDPDDLAPVLRAEVARLPEKYRAPVVLCYLEGLTCAAAAGRLGCPVGTVKVRLSRARDLLRTRLTRRGLALPAALAAAGLAARPAAAAPAALLGVASARAAALAGGVLQVMLMDSLKLAASVALALGMATAGVGALARQDGAVAPAPAAPPDDPTPREAEAAPARRDLQTTVAGALKAARAIEDPTERAMALWRLGATQARRGELEAARPTLQRASEATEAIKPEDSADRVRFFSLIASAQVEAGDREVGHRTFERASQAIPSHSEIGRAFNDWNDLLMQQVKAEGRAASRGNLDRYRGFLEQIAALPPDAAIFPKPAEGFREGRMLINMAVVNLIRTLARGGDYEGALRKVEAIPDPQRHLRPAALIAILSEMGPDDRVAAGPISRAAKQAIEEDIRADAFTFGGQGVQAHVRSELVDAQARLGMFEEATATLAAIDPAAAREEESAAVLESRRYAEIMLSRVMAKAGDRAGARKFARAAIADADAMTNPMYRVGMRIDAAQILIQAGDPDEARRIAEGLDFDGRISVLEWIAMTRRQAGHEEGAKAAFREALKLAEDRLRDRDLSPSIRDQVTTKVAGIEARLGDQPAALRAADSLKDAGARQEARLQIACILAETGAVESARALVDSLESPKLRDRGLLEIACAAPGRTPARDHPNPKTP